MESQKSARKQFGPTGKLAILLLIMAVVGFGIIGWKRAQPVHTTGSDVPDAAKLGNVAAAMEQSRKLLAEMKAAHWNAAPGVVPLELMYLPDVQYAEDKTLRDHQTTSYAFPGDSPEYSQVAFYTPIYRRRNISYYRGGTSSSKPTGFYIVGWKDGRVEQLPIEKIRLMKTQTGGPVECFPGMTGYREDLPKPPWLDSSAANVQRIMTLR